MSKQLTHEEDAQSTLKRAYHKCDLDANYFRPLMIAVIVAQTVYDDNPHYHALHDDISTSRIILDGGLI